MSVPRKGVSVFTIDPSEGNFIVCPFFKVKTVWCLIWSVPVGGALRRQQVLLLQAWFSHEGNLKAENYIVVRFDKIHGQRWMQYRQAYDNTLAFG